MNKVFRYTVIAAIACIMVLGARIATQELNAGVEYYDYDLENAARISAEPSFNPVNYDRPSFGMEDSASLDSLPQMQAKAEAQPVAGDEQEGEETASASTGAKAQTASKGSSTSASGGSSSEGKGTASTGKGSAETQGSTQSGSSAGSGSTGESSSGTTTQGNSKYSWYEPPAGYEGYYDGDFYLISYPKGWAKKNNTGEYGGIIFESGADAQGDKTTMTLVSTQLDNEDGLRIFAESGNEVANEAIANAGLNASIVDKGYAAAGPRSSYYMIIDVPNGDKATQISQYYVFYKDKVLLVEFSGVKGKVSGEQIKKVIGSFMNK